MATINVNTTRRYASEVLLIVMECPTCGISHAIPELMQREAYSEGHGKVHWYCPNGHRLSYPGPSQAEQKATRLQAEADREKAWRRDAEKRVETERRSHAATKGQLTKTRKRIAGGACPCCNRSFENLARHMAGQHPGFAEAVTA